MGLVTDIDVVYVEAHAEFVKHMTLDRIIARRNKGRIHSQHLENWALVRVDYMRRDQ